MCTEYINQNTVLVICLAVTVVTGPIVGFIMRGIWEEAKEDK